MLALAFFPPLVQRLRLLGWAAVAGGALLALAILWSTGHGLPGPLGLLGKAGDAKLAANLAVGMSLVMMTCSVGLIVSRLLSREASRRKFRPAGAVQAVFALFWRQHKLVGWMALALAGAHSVYFLLHPRTMEEQWTGVGAIALLGMLGVVGLVTSYRARAALWVHRGIALALGVVLTLHWPPLLGIEVAALVGIGVMALVNLKAAAAIVDVVLARS